MSIGYDAMRELGARVTLYSGTVATLADGTSSAISKTPLQGRCYISPLGIHGDACADTRHHGGADRALLFYPREHYDTLSRSFSPATPLYFGCLGENLSGENFPESKVCIGDIFALGDAIIQISQPRSPCFKLGIRCGDRHAPRVIQDSGLTGYFFRVLSPGECDPVENLALLQRLEPDLTVLEAGRIYFSENASKNDLEKLASSAALCERWKEKIKKRLLTGIPEASEARLYGPPPLNTSREMNDRCDNSALSKKDANSTTYVPIDCDLHDYLEIAGLRNYSIRVSCIDGGNLTIRVKDLMTKADKTEWLIGIEVDTSEQREIRLDQIRDITAVESNSDFSFVDFR